MENFNKYLFVENVTASIKAEIANGNLIDHESMHQFLCEEVDNACIYYSDCFAICEALGATDFETGFGIAKNIKELAFYTLFDYAYDKINFDKLLK